MRPDGTLCFRVSWMFVPCNYFFDVFWEMPVGCTVFTIFGVYVFLFSASAFTLGSPAGVGGDLIWFFVWHYFCPIFLICSQFFNFVSDICVWHFFWHTSRHWFEPHIKCVTFGRHISIFCIFFGNSFWHIFLHFAHSSGILRDIVLKRGQWGGGRWR